MTKTNRAQVVTGGLTVAEEKTVYRAMRVLERAMKREEVPVFTSPTLTRVYLCMRMGTLEHEEFHVLWLDNRHRLIAADRMFTGTIDAAAVYPREIVKGALQINAAAVIVAHNHPSGVPEPSQSDRTLTDRLRDALNLVDVRLLDHVIVGGNDTVSFSERGWL